MFATLSRAMLVAGLAVLLGCEGPSGEGGPKGDTGKQGPTGPAGPEGPGFGVGRSISGVFPASVVQGHAAELQISGYATDWAEGEVPVVDFGPGITVIGVTVASNSALFVRIAAEADAASGKRSIVVTSASDALTFGNGFEVKVPYTVRVPVLTPLGGISTVVVARNDLTVTLPVASEAYSVSAPDGFEAGFLSANFEEALFWVWATGAAQVGTAEVTVTVHPGEPGERVVAIPVAVGNVAPTVAVEGTTAGTQLPFTSVRFSYTAASGGSKVVSVTTQSGPAPAVYVMNLEADTLLAEADEFFVATAGTEYSIVAWSISGASSGFELTIESVASHDESEPNDTLGTANELSGETFDLNGEVDDVDLNDWFKVTATGLSGRRVSVVHHGDFFDADFCVQVVGSDGATSHGTSDNLYLEPAWVSEPLSGGSHFYLRVFPCGLFDGPYSVRVELK